MATDLVGMERPASRGRLGVEPRGGSAGGRGGDPSDDEDEHSRAESYHSRRSLTTTGGTGHSRSDHSCNAFVPSPNNPPFYRHNSSNCINVYSSYTTDPLQTASGHDIDGASNVRRSASGVFRHPIPGEDSENQFSDQLYLLENGCNRHGHVMPEYSIEDVYHNPKDPFDG